MKQASERAQREFIGLRLVWMLGFFVIWHLAEMLLAVVVLLQIGYQLFSGAPNPALCEFGSSLAQYLKQIAGFGTFNTEQKPWPFSDWPAPELVEQVSMSSEL